MESKYVYQCVILVIAAITTSCSGRKCISGMDLQEATDAHQTIECGQHETCYLEQYVTPNGNVLNKAGCKDTKFCGTGSVQDPNIGVCSECCNDKDLCATTLCGSPGWPQNTGPICYHCANPISDPALCSDIKICGRDEKCGVSADGNGKYLVQCMSQQVCTDNEATSTCSSCCSTQLCNVNCTQRTIVTTTTPAPTTTPLPTTPAATTPVCADDPGCQTLVQTFQANGEDICQKAGVNSFCNKTCSLCPGMSTQPTIATTKFDACSVVQCQHGVCSVLSSGQFHCTCDQGYVGVLCDRPDPCTTFTPCQHGSCSSFQNGTYVCTCDAGFEGVLCDASVRPCSSNPCKNQATCYNNGDKYQCHCATGFIGQDCSTVNPCNASPCQHGICSYLNNGSFTCACSAGYSGTLCDKASGPCTNNPCVHGNCVEVSSSNTFTCTCNDHWIGTLCDKHDPCDPSPCNNGTCSVESSGQVLCKCNTGFTGDLCDTALVTCSNNPNICHHGSCQNDGNNVKCLCNTGWTGHYCNKAIKDCNDVKHGHNTQGHTTAEVHTVQLGGHATDLMCDMVTLGGGWTVIMNRHDNSINFPDKNYTEYTNGFGDINGDFWAGLQKMHDLTKDGRHYQLRVELQVANGSVYVANYYDFSIGASNEFALHVGAYNGTAGDSLSGHDGFGFTTKEVDHDSNSINCGWYLQGAWWFHTCYDSCLTCPYLAPGSDNRDNCRVFSWNALGYCIALKSARMMVRPM